MVAPAGGRPSPQPSLARATTSETGEWRGEFSFELLPIDRLRAHEATNPLLLRVTIEAIEREGEVRRPLLVEREHHIILDGHHRFAALRALGCRRAPAYVAAYSTPMIQLSTWPGAPVDHITKEEVVRQVMERKMLFPPKTTRHIVQVQLPDHPVSLEELRRP